MSRVYYHDSNYKRPFNTEEFYGEIVDKVSEKLKRQLETTEISQVKTFIRKIDPDLLKPSHKNKSISIMVDTLVNEFSSYECLKPAFETQQFLRNTIGLTSESGTTHGVYDNAAYSQKKVKKKPSSNSKQSKQSDQTDEKKSSQLSVIQNVDTPFEIESLFGLTSIDAAVRSLNPASLTRKNYMFMDSRYRGDASNSHQRISEYTWGYVQKSQLTSDGFVNVIGNVREIIGLRIYPFRIPYDTTADNNKYARVSILIKELESQSFIAHEQRKFHFMARSTVDNKFIELDTDDFNDGYFWFEKPITTIPSLTLTFGNPIEKISFDNDRDSCTIDYFGIAPLTQITTSSNHNLASGDLVYFTKFDVGTNPIPQQKIINQNIKNEINRTSGYVITVITPTTFSIAFQSNGILNPIANITFDVFYGSKRMFVPMELIYIQPEITSAH